MKVNGTLKRGLLLAGLVFFILLFLALKFTDSFSPSELKPQYLVFSFISALLILLCEALRFFSVSKILKGKNLSFREALAISFAGVFWARVTPGGAGGEPFQLYLMSKKGVNTGEGTAMIFVNAILSVTMRVILLLMIPFLLMLYSIPDVKLNLVSESLFLALIIGIVVLGILLYILFHPQIIILIGNYLLSRRFTIRILTIKRTKMYLDFIKIFIDDFQNLSKEWNQIDLLNIISAFFLIFGGWMLTALIPYFLLKSINIATSFPLIFILTIISRALTDFLPIPGSIGVQELSIATIFKTLVPFNFLWSFVFVWRILFYYLPLIITALVSYSLFFAEQS